MRARFAIATILVLSTVAAGGYGLYRLGISRGMQMTAATSVTGDQTAPHKAGDIDPATGKRVLYWHDPMVPGQKFDKPGKSPFMDMQLVPVYAGSEGDEGKVVISPRLQQNLGVRTARVTTGTLESRVEAVGSVAYNERDVAAVQARANGYVEKLHVRAPLDAVRKGQALAELYVPEWVAAQEEYLTVKRMAATSAGMAPLLDGARQRMRLAGMTEDQIGLVESTGRVHPRLTVTAPIEGVITELGAREGMTVMAGAPLFRINALSTVWLNAEVSEAQATLVRPGAPVQARAPALPGEIFKGRVSTILPEVSAATRTLRARVELNNPGRRLMPGMFATVDFTSSARKETLLVPTEAVIQTGTRTVVILAQDGGGFAPVDVELGLEANGQSEIRKGLEAGQKVVVSGQFLLDSEASLRSSATRMSPMPGTDAPAGTDAIHRGEGKVEAIGKDEITLSHGPIPSLQWGPMTMGFKLPAEKAPKGLRVGDSVAFEIRAMPDGMYQITRISPIGGTTEGAMKKDSTTGAKR
jgi:membrane fusion protein, copper/silver efflux system